MPMMAAGKRRHRIEFQVPAASRNALGGKAPASWAGIGTRLASVLYGSGGERRVAAGEGAVKTATFRTLADSLTRTITETHRISYDGLDWDIADITPISAIGTKTSEIEFTATAAKG